MEGEGLEVLPAEDRFALWIQVAGDSRWQRDDADGIAVGFRLDDFCDTDLATRPGLVDNLDLGSKLLLHQRSQ